MLSITAQFMKMLLLGVFSFFGLHTALWLGRGMQQKAAHQRRRRNDDDDSTEDGE
jgi:hypothetical protein